LNLWDRKLEAFDERERLGELREEGFLGFKFAGVDAAAETAHLDRVLEVEHLVVEQVFERVAGT
jgi:hypothetical protein